jgi:hypothetical protein
MKAMCSSETLVSTNKSIRRHYPEEQHRYVLSDIRTGRSKPLTPRRDNENLEPNNSNSHPLTLFVRFTLINISLHWSSTQHIFRKWDLRLSRRRVMKTATFIFRKFHHRNIVQVSCLSHPSQMLGPP